MTEISVRNPYSGVEDFTFQEPEAEAVAAEIDQLRSAQSDWAKLELADRLGVLQEFANGLRQHMKPLLTALVADTGRTQVAAMELGALQGFIERAQTLAPEALTPAPPRQASIPAIEGSSNAIPLGVVANISPWNFPIILSFLDTIPALAAGNAVIIKPSEVTPRWTVPMREILADFPELGNVLHIEPGTGITGAEIIKHVDALVFTGSVATGQKVAAAAAEQFIPAFLELGGKDPAVVLEGADIETAAQALTFAASQSAGQACQSIERAYVPAQHFDEFIQVAVATANSMQLNYPDIESGVVGPFIFPPQGGKVLQQLADARGAGAEILCGGELLNHGGSWMRPTVVVNVSHDMDLMREETFGPVLPVMPYATEEEAVQLANDSDYGLSAAVFAADTDAAKAFAARLNAGAVSINDAALTAVIHDFEHDAFASSGLGASRSGLSAYRRFTRQQSVMVNTSGQPVLQGSLE